MNGVVRIETCVPAAVLSFWPWRKPCSGRPAASCRTLRSALYLQPRRSPRAETSPSPSPGPPPNLCAHTHTHKSVLNILLKMLEDVQSNGSPWPGSTVLECIRGAAGVYLAFMGMTPLDPTPTGMWSKRAWASCSFTGCTSPSSRLVLSRRTPQLMSNPTPPAQVHPHC